MGKVENIKYAIMKALTDDNSKLATLFKSRETGFKTAIVGIMGNNTKEDMVGYQNQITSLIDRDVVTGNVLIMTNDEFMDIVSVIVDSLDIVGFDVELGDTLYLLNDNNGECEVVECVVKLVRYVKNQKGREMTTELLLKPKDDNKVITQGSKMFDDLPLAKHSDETNMVWTTSYSADRLFYTDINKANERCAAYNNLDAEG